MKQDELRREIVKELEPVRKALVIQGSPRGRNGRTEHCLQRLLDGIREKGIDAEVIYLHQHKINSCTGCFACWVQTPGVCIHKDDMPGFLEKIKEADLLIWAQPLYVYTVPGITKNFMDRSLPLAEPWLIQGPDGTSNHPRRVEEKKRLLILSVAGFPEVDHFKPMVEMFRWWSRGGNFALVGELLRPAAEAMPAGDKLGPAYGKVMDALYAAGKEIAEQGYVSIETEQLVSTPFFSNPEAFREIGTRHFKAQIEYYQAKREGKAMPPLGEYIDNNPSIQLGGMAGAFNPEKAGDLRGIIQFDVSGDQPGWYYLETKDGQCRLRDGRAENPGLTIHTPWDVWKAISNGELSGQDALMEGKYKVEGDIGLLIRMGEIFGG